MSSPIARQYPVFRRVSFSGPRRESIEDLFEDDAAAPPRVLLFGYASPELPHVRTEIEALREAFTRRYERNEWPTEIVESLTDEKATFDNLKLAVSRSDFDILHIAGHAGWTNDGPVLQVAAVGQRPSFVRSGELGQWLHGSSVRFVYLSCCNGASMPLTGAQFAGWRQSLCRDVIEAGVAEVAAYFWPISDQRSVRFASAFYESFLRDFDAPGAMLRARRATMADDPVWAGSVIVKAPKPKGRT
jgi:CHAT domain-containing protein